MHYPNAVPNRAEAHHTMSINRSQVASAATPNFVRPAVIRTGLALALLAAATAFAVRAGAQETTRAGLGLRPLPGIVSLRAAEHAPSPAAALRGTSSGIAFAAVPFAVGEELVYKATFGGLPAGSARMRVDGIEAVRGRPAYHVVFSIDGGIPFYRVHDRYESWIDVQTLASLRHRQNVAEGGYKRNTRYEIFPEHASYQKDDEPMEASVGNPLDDGSFVYAARVSRPEVGETRRDDRYFRPDRNPVILTGLRHETVSVPAGRFDATVVRPSIKANGLFSENGDAQIWFSDDAARVPVLLKTKFSRFTLTLALQSMTRGDASAHARLAEEAVAAR
jgi:hypothetical protein